MIFQMAGDLISGGWDALSNITTGIGKGVGRIGSTFFPSPQRIQPIKSEITQQGNYSTLPYTKTADAPSVWETFNMVQNEWLGSPYQDQYSPAVKSAAAAQLEQLVSATGQPGVIDNLFTGLKGLATTSREIRTLADELIAPWSTRETVYSKPQAGYPEGRDEQHLNNLAQAAANVWETTKTSAQAMLDQVKGLFNVGFPQQGGQPVFGVTHEIQPSKGLSAGLIIAGIVIVLVILLSRKK